MWTRAVPRGVLLLARLCCGAPDIRMRVGASVPLLVGGLARRGAVRVRAQASIVISKGVNPGNKTDTAQGCRRNMLSFDFGRVSSVCLLTTRRRDLVLSRVNPIILDKAGGKQPAKDDSVQSILLDDTFMRPLFAKGLKYQ